MKNRYLTGALYVKDHDFVQNIKYSIKSALCLNSH